MTRKRFATTVLVTLLMMSTVSVAFTGTVGAQDTEVCDVHNEGFWDDIYHLMYGNYYTENCRDITVEDSTDAWTTVDIMRSDIPNNEHQSRVTVDEYKTALAGEGISVYRNAILNGSNQVEARDKAFDAIDEMANAYARTMIRHNDNRVRDAYSAIQNNKSGIPANDGPGYDNPAHITRANVSLPTGENATIKVTYSEKVSSGTTHYNASFSMLDPLAEGVNGNLEASQTQRPVYHKGVDGQSSMSEIYARPNNYSTIWQDLDSYHQLAYEEVTNFHANTNESELESGKIAVPPSEMASYAAENHTGYSAALLASSNRSMDLQNPVNIGHDGTNYSGVLGLSPSLKDSAGNLSQNDTLDLSKYNGTAYVVDESGKSHQLTDGTLEIQPSESLSDGEQMEFRTYDYADTSNVTRTLEELRTFADAQENASTIYPSPEDNNQSDGIGFPDLSQGDGTIVMVLMVLGGLFVLFLGLAGVVLLMRSVSGGSSDFSGGGR